MTRPRWIWGIFSICFLVATGATGWISYTMLRLDRADYEARKQAESEENIRLALWRMESALAPLVAKENTRSSAVYEDGWDWSSLSPQQVYGQLGLNQQLDVSALRQAPPPVGDGRGALAQQAPPSQQAPPPQQAPPSQQEAGGSSIPRQGIAPVQQLAAAPDLILESSPGILVHFRIQPDGAAPAQLGGAVPPPEWAQRVQDLNDNFAAVEPHLDYAQLVARLPEPEQEAPTLPTNDPLSNVVSYGGKLQERQSYRNNQEFNARQQVQGFNGALMSQLRDTLNIGKVGVMQALWLDERLLLARRARFDGIERIEGCWLNWPKLQQVLVEEVRDLVPNASLAPIPPGNTEAYLHRLATIPARLIPGEMPFEAMPFWTPARSSLAVAWGFLALAGIAVAILLGGTIALSERRHDFVSAVTHELRTPLTTFRMYSEMLAGGMVDEEKKQPYLEKLQQESDRLGHLVENVLAFARVERSARAEERSETALRPFLDGIENRLAEHARQQGMQLVLKTHDLADDSHSVRIAPGTVEQILLNLTDNACKYGRSGNDKEESDAPDIVISVTTTSSELVFTVQDWGPGVDTETVKRLFRPFAKSDSKAATTAPGVGLGLALSRRLARTLGGDLTHRSQRGPGAHFEVRVPRG